MKNIAVFWDLDNVHLTIQEKFGAQEDYLSNLIDKVFELFNGDSIRIFRAYADFEKIIKVQSKIQKKRVTPKHVFSSNSGSDNRKNASDIELCLDALEVAISNKEIDYFVIISADKDMIPLMHRLRYYNKYTHLIYLKEAIADDQLILEFVNTYSAIEDLIALHKVSTDGLTEDQLKELSKDAVEIVNNFYERNKEKPNLFFGIPFYKEDMITKKGHSGDVALKILEYCIDNGILCSKELDNGRIKITVKEAVLA